MPKTPLRAMLEWKRPEGSETQRWWCQHYLEPVMGKPDEDDNYIHIVYEKDSDDYPQVVFAAHHDTVHRDGGSQTILSKGDELYTVGSDCLGADCTTGCWLILGMIEQGVPGIYVIHSGEEIGCVGSSALVERYPDWLLTAKAVISFDRKGTTSIITHQMGSRTCSDEFALSLSDALGMPQLEPDDTGAYTDSNEYRHKVSECTNISVGYKGQHTRLESQNVFFAYQLLNALINADWSKLVFVRDPSKRDDWDDKHSGWWDNYRSGDYAKRYGGYERSDDLDWDSGYTDYTKGKKPDPRWDEDDEERYRKDYASVHKNNIDNLTDIICDFPDEVASILEDWGVDAEWLYNQLELVYDDKMEKKYGLRKH